VAQPGFSGDDSFTYQATDLQSGLSNEATVFITVLANNLPVANDDLAQTIIDIPVTIDVLANDTDADEDPLTIVLWDANSSSGGTVDCSSGIACAYTPPLGFLSPPLDTFTYTIDDAHGGTDTATVTVNVTDIAVTLARYNENSRRWLVQGLGEPGATITAYNGTCDPTIAFPGTGSCDPANAIGTSPVDALGAWSINERAAAPIDDFVTLVSDTGTSAVATVTFR
jgi:hypothetical protein